MRGYNAYQVRHNIVFVGNAMLITTSLVVAAPSRRWLEQSATVSECGRASEQRDSRRHEQNALACIAVRLAASAVVFGLIFSIENDRVSYWTTTQDRLKEKKEAWISTLKLRKLLLMLPAVLPYNYAEYVSNYPV